MQLSKKVDGRRNASKKANDHRNLLKAKASLDNVLLHLNGYPELRQDAVALREKMLKKFMEEDLKGFRDNRVRLAAFS